MGALLHGEGALVAEKGVSRDEFYIEHDLEVGQEVAYYDYGWVEDGHFLGRDEQGWARIHTYNATECGIEPLEFWLNEINAGRKPIGCGLLVQPHQVRKPGDY